MLKIDKHYREATIAILDNISASTVTGAVVEMIFKKDITLIAIMLLILTTVLFAVGVVLRKKGENHVG